MRRWMDGVVVRMAAVMAVAGAASAWGLEPGDIVVLFNTKSPSSLAVARYYMNARKVPADHLIPLTCEVEETISEKDYRGTVVPQLVKALKDRKLLADEGAGVGEEFDMRASAIRIDTGEGTGVAGGAGVGGGGGGGVSLGV